jgi:transcriptional regulator with XRE-family HTH domain
MVTPTREAQRLQWLIIQFERKGMSQAEFARRTGLHPPYLNAIRNMETAGARGIGAEIVRRVKDGLRIDPAYFYDDYEGERDHQLYPLSAKRDEKRVSAIEEELAAVRRDVAGLSKQLAENTSLKATVLEQSQHIARLQRELAAKAPRKKN